jgi:hypothetical protein
VRSARRALVVAMTESQTDLQTALTAERTRTRKRLDMWVLLSCHNPRCSVKETNVFVHEDGDCRPFQKPVFCIRCREPLTFQGLEREGK